MFNYYLVVLAGALLEQHFLSPPFVQDDLDSVVEVAFPAPVVVVAEVVPFDFEQQEDDFPSAVADLLQQDFALAGSVVVVVAV